MHKGMFVLGEPVSKSEMCIFGDTDHSETLLVLSCEILKPQLTLVKHLQILPIAEHLLSLSRFFIVTGLTKWALSF